jgi:hypothetical protein
VDVSAAILNDTVVGDTVSFDGDNVSGTFAQSDVNTDIAVTMSNLALTGDDAANYSVTDASAATADITAKALTINTDIASTTKVYDGSTDVDITSANLSGVVGDDDVTASGSGNFDNKNVGTNKTITVVYELSGDDAGNYSLDGTTATGDITAKALTIGGITAANKTYDGDTSATVDVSAATFTGLVEGDDVTVSATGVFSDKNVDTNKP